MGILIDNIVAATQRACPAIVKRTYYRHGDCIYTPMGGFPHGVGPEDCERFERFVFFSARDNTVYGKVANTEQELRDRHKADDAERMAEFRAVLEKMTPSELQRQAEYWLKMQSI